MIKFILLFFFIFIIDEDSFALIQEMQGSSSHIKLMNESDAFAFRLVLTDIEQKVFDQLETASKKTKWADIYWIRNDPTPLTTKNENQDEYNRRVSYARRVYSAPTISGFDDRGKIYVKYGEPLLKYVEPMGTEFAKANESWSYADRYNGLTFDFIGDGSTFKLTNNFRRLVVARSISEPFVAEQNALLSLFQARSHLDLKYAEVAVALDLVSARPQNLDAIIQQFSSETMRIQDNAPLSIYEDNASTDLLLENSRARFRGPNNNIRLEVYFGVPVDKLQFSQFSNRWATQIRTECAIFDSTYSRVGSDSANIELRALNEENTKHGVYTSQINFLLSPGEYHVVTRLFSSFDGRFDTNTIDIICPIYSSDSLTMSDIQLSSSIAEMRQTDDDNRYIKNDLRISPIAGTRVLHSKPLFLYFEIYGLSKDPYGKTHFELQYTLKTDNVRNNLLGKLFGLFGRRQTKLSISQQRHDVARDQVEHISIDLSKQNMGKYTLSVKITDYNSNKSTQSSISIQII